MIQRHSMSVQVRAVDGRSITFVASTDKMARDGMILAQNWDLDGFKRNPLFLWSHNSRELPIGKVTRVWVSRGDGDGLIRGDKLMIRVQFISEELNPFAEKVRQFYEEGYLSAVSVGFVPKSMRLLSDDEKEALKLKGFAIFVERSELLEVSAVGVPADKEALKAEFSGISTERTASFLDDVEFEMQTLSEDSEALRKLKEAVDEIETRVCGSVGCCIDTEEEGKDDSEDRFRLLQEVIEKGFEEILERVEEKLLQSTQNDPSLDIQPADRSVEDALASLAETLERREGMNNGQ